MHSKSRGQKNNTAPDQQLLNLNTVPERSVESQQPLKDDDIYESLSRSLIICICIRNKKDFDHIRSAT